MIVRFDSLNRFEVPKFYVCNPGCVYNDGVLTSTLGCLADTTDEELILNFNTTSELNFRINRIHRTNADENAYALKLYKAIQNRRLIFVEDVGFFVITDVTDGYDAGIHYKDVRAESCEYEISNKALPYIEDGTYLFTDLLETIVASLPLWTIGDVNGDVAKKYRTFEDVGVDKNALSFLLEDMQDAYECIFVCDTIKRQIDVYDQNYFVNQTGIHITKDDLINSIEIKESSDDLYTAINVQGDDYLNISPVNPLGSNVIYRFDYYLDWMTPSLAARVKEWQALVDSKLSSYYDLNLNYYEYLTNRSNSNSTLDMLNIQLDTYQRMRDNIVAEGSTATVESYNAVIEENGGVPVGIQNEIAATLAEIDSLMTDVKNQIAEEQSALGSINDDIDEVMAAIEEIHDEIDILSYFTNAEYSELSNYIFEGNYTDEYIAVTESMTYSERFQQMKTLYDRAVARLERISEPTQEFDLDVENFLFEKEFAEWSAQLETGCLINVELDTDNIAALFLSNIAVNYDDKSLSMTFGNRFNRFDPKAMFDNVLGDIKKSANSINYIKEILYPVKSGEFDVMKEAIESSQILTKNSVLTSTDQEILIDDTGILCRKLLENGEYDPRQIKVTNQTIVFTEDGWTTASTGVGNFLFNNPLSGEVEEHYGVIANTLIGNLVLSQEVGIYNTDNSITLDKNGFTLTTDQTGYAESQNVFIIQKKLLNESGNEYYEKQLYIDDDGNVVLNGTISIFTETGSNTSIGDVVTNIESIDTEIKDINEELKAQADAIAGIDGIFFFVRYSDVEDGNPMYESPRDTTMYIGTCSTNMNVAPTDPSEYTWARLRFDGVDGTPGLDGTSQFFHVKYSDDGETFTDNNGEELGDWMGTCVTEEEADPTDFDAYEWHKIKGEPGTDGLDGKDGIAGKDGTDGKTTYFHVKYSNIADPQTVSDMTEEPSKYIGTYVDYTEADSTDPADYKWVKFMGEDGIDGIPGENGADGKTYYLHIKYSDDGGKTFSGNLLSNNPDDWQSGLIAASGTINSTPQTSDASFLSSAAYAEPITVVPGDVLELTIDGDYNVCFRQYNSAGDYISTSLLLTASVNYTIPADVYYIRITIRTSYSNFTEISAAMVAGEIDPQLYKSSEKGEQTGAYIGVYTDTVEDDSSDVNDYKWSLIKGENGSDGITYYTWIKYADTPTSGMSDSPDGKKYMGLAYNKTEPTESANYSDYTWSLIKGEDGTDGINGINGIDGKTYYTWVKYADDASGTNMTNDPTGKEYIGLAYNKDTATESNDPADYSWALFKGSDGVNGQDGADGISCYFYVRYSANANGSSMTTSPTDTTQYMGVCSTTSPTAPTSYTSYTWTRCKGEDGTNGTPGQAGADGRTQYLHVKYSDDGVIFTGCLVSHNISDWESGLIGASDTIESSPQTSATSFLSYVAYKEPIPVVPGQVYSVKTGNTHTVVLRGYDANGNYSQTSGTLTDSMSYTIPSDVYYLRVNIRTNYSSFEEISSAFASGEIAPIIYNTEYGIGEALGAYIGTLVDFTEADSTTFSDYTWKKFTEDVDEELQELQDQLDHKTDVLEETIQNSINDLHDEIQSESDEINNRIDAEIGNINQSITEQVNSVSSSINAKYDALMSGVEDQLTAHKAEVGQYMTFNDDGLTLGATSSEFKTVIDNVGMYFKQGNVVVSYVNNNQLYIPNAVIESTLILGNFFFSPRDDGGVSLTWQE